MCPPLLSHEPVTDEEGEAQESRLGLPHAAHGKAKANLVLQALFVHEKRTLRSSATVPIAEPEA